MTTPAQLVKRARTFVVAHAAPNAFAAHTGQDARAWVAFVCLVDLWTAADRAGRSATVAAMAATLAAAQRSRSVHQTFALVVPAFAEWGDLAELWPRIDGLPLGELGVASSGRTGELDLDRLVTP